MPEKKPDLIKKTSAERGREGKKVSGKNAAGGSSFQESRERYR